MPKNLAKPNTSNCQKPHVNRGVPDFFTTDYPASTVAPYTLLVPIAGIGSAALVLGETVSSLEWIGSVLVFCGLLLNVFGAKVLSRARAIS